MSQTNTYHRCMRFRFVLRFLLCVAGVTMLMPPTARAQNMIPPTVRALGSGGAMRGFATGDSGPQLNPSGISLLRAYSLEGSYLYGSAGNSHDARISAVDSTSGFNLGGAFYYNYHRDSPTSSINNSGHLVGGSLSFPILDKFFLGASAKYIHFTDITRATSSGFVFDAGLTLRPVSMVSLGAVGTNLFDKSTPWAPRSLGGGVAILPMPTLILLFDTVWQKVYGDDSRDQVVSYMGGGEFSFSDSAALRLGGGRDGLSKSGYVAAGVSVIGSAVGALDVGVRQDVSGNSKTTMVGASARLFVPGM